MSETASAQAWPPFSINSAKRLTPESSPAARDSSSSSSTSAAPLWSACDSSQSAARSISSPWSCSALSHRRADDCVTARSCFASSRRSFSLSGFFFRSNGSEEAAATESDPLTDSVAEASVEDASSACGSSRGWKPPFGAGSTMKGSIVPQRPSEDSHRLRLSSTDRPCSFSWSRSRSAAL
eukprot:scaffold33407_cov112-Isochrysis_galbana.AAC.4